MSIVEKLLDQKIIIYSLIAIGLLILVVLLLIMIGQVTTIMAKRRRQKARLQMRQQLTPTAALTTSSTREGLATSTSPTTASPTPTGDMAKPALVVTAQPPGTSADEQIAAASGSTIDPAQGSTPPAQPEAQVSSTMQDILSSVFIDEDVVARYEVLLRGQQHVDITDLLVLSRKVTAQLRARILDIETRTGRS